MAPLLMPLTITIRKDAIADLIRVKEDFDAIIESIEQMGDENFMASYLESKKQIENREFSDLQ